MANLIKNQTSLTRRRVTKLYDLYAARDLRKAVANFSEDIDWGLMGSEAFFPYVNRRLGRSAVLETFEGIQRAHEVIQFEPTMILADGDQACVTTTVVLRNLQTQNAATIEVCSLLRLDSEQQVKVIREFLDSASATMFLAGRFNPRE